MQRPSSQRPLSDARALAGAGPAGCSGWDWGWGGQGVMLKVL